MRAAQLTRLVLRAGSSNCRACRPHRRNLASNSTSPPQPPRQGLAVLTSRRLISVTGPDAAKFLNGVITNTFTGRSPIYTAFLSAQGRILHDVFVYPHPSPGHRDGFVIEVDASTADTLQRHIRRFKLRSKFETRIVPDGELAVYHAWYDAKSVMVDAANGEFASYQLVDPRAPGLGTRLLVNPSAPPPSLEFLEKAPESAYTIRRYLHGVAEGPKEIIPESALPAETNLDLASAIDWHKGCYVGQELTIRTRHRGVVRKRILPCVVYGEEGEAPPQKLEYRGSQPGILPAEEVPTGANIVGAGEGRVKSAGKWLSGIGNVGLALCRLEQVNKGLSEEPEGQFVIRPVVVEGEDVGEKPDARVKVKPFLPDWLVKGMESQNPST